MAKGRWQKAKISCRNKVLRIKGTSCTLEFVISAFIIGLRISTFQLHSTLCHPRGGAAGSGDLYAVVPRLLRVP